MNKKGNTDRPRMGHAVVAVEKQERDLNQHILLLSNLLYDVTPIRLPKLAYNYNEANNIKHLFIKNARMAG